MQCVLREKLLAEAMKLSKVSDVYRTDSHRFVAAYMDWLETAEKELSGLRSPISILLQSEKSALTSVLDGYTPNFIQAEKSVRKTQKAVAAQSLEKLSKEFYSKIESIDHVLDQLSEKLCHAVAVLASKEPELYAQVSVSKHGVQSIWRMLSNTPETLPMYNYFCAKLASTDINYLLMDIVQKVAGNTVKNGLSPIIDMSSR